MSEKNEQGDITVDRLNEELLDALLTREYKQWDIVCDGFPYRFAGSPPTRSYTKTRFVWLYDGGDHTLAVIPEEGEPLIVCPADGLRHIGSGFWAIPTGEEVSVTDAETWWPDEAMPVIGTYDDAGALGSGWIVLTKGDKKNAIIPSASRSSLFFRGWADDITSIGCVSKVRYGDKVAAFNKDGGLLVDDVVSVAAYGSMSFIKHKTGNIIINDKGVIILKNVGTFTGFGEYAAIRYGKGAYEIVNTDGQRHFPCEFESVRRLGMGRVGLMYHGLWYIFDKDFNRLSGYGFNEVDRYVNEFGGRYCPEGFLLVSLNNKYNYLAEDGNILLPFWCDKAGRFSPAKTARIEHNGTRYIVYDCTNETAGAGVFCAARPNIRVRKEL